MGLLDYDLQLAKNKLQGLLSDGQDYVTSARNKLMDVINNPQPYIDSTNQALRDQFALDQSRQQFALRDRIKAGDQSAIQEYRALDKQVQNKLMQVATNFNPMAVGMTAWHGSPHKFDKFDLSKIGTGEGAQAYGHGMYLAESKGVADGYRDALAPRDGAVRIVKNGNIIGEYASDGRVTPYKTDHWQEISALVNADGNVANAIKFLSENEKYYAKESPNIASQMRAALRELESNKYEWADTPGHLYKTDIPDEAVARFLDWDKPLSQQAPEVQSAFKSMVGDVTNGGFDLSRSPRNVARAFDNSSADDALKALQSKYGITNSGGQFFDKNGNPIASDVVQRHVDKIAGKGYENAGQLYSDLTHITGSQADISAALRNNGIPGIRYLDGGSRSAGQGSSNFVIFDPEMIRILERNGEATGAQPWKPGEWGGLLK